MIKEADKLQNIYNILQNQFELQYDVVAQRPMMKMNGQLEKIGTKHIALITQMIVMQSGVMPSTSELSQFLMIAHMKEFNPVFKLIKDYIDENKEIKKDWKKFEATKTLANELISDTMPEWRHNKSKETFLEFFFRKWLTGLVAMNVSNKAEPSPLTLTLIGGQNLGKTFYLRNVLPSELKKYIKVGSLFESNDKDSDTAMTENILIIEDELASLGKRDIETFKTKSTAREFKIRKPYAIDAETYLRRAALAGTSNVEEIIKDPTGNRRIIPLKLSGRRDKLDDITETEKIKALAECYMAYKVWGESAYILNKQDVVVMNQASGLYKKVSVLEGYIKEYFRPPIGNEGCASYTPTEFAIVMKHVLRTEANYITPQNIKEAFHQIGIEQRMVKRKHFGVKRLYQISSGSLFFQKGIQGDIERDLKISVYKF